VLSDFQVALCAGVQQVSYALVVDLQVRHFDSALHELVVLNAVDSAEHVSANARNHTLLIAVSHHTVTLSGTRLSIGEDAVVVALESIVQQRLTQVVEQIVLTSIALVLFVE
jgi:hypothetical protein